MYETRRKTNAASWRTAFAQYRRLLAVSESLPNNHRSGLKILREGIAGAPQLEGILLALHGAEAPLTTREIYEWGLQDRLFKEQDPDEGQQDIASVITYLLDGDPPMVERESRRLKAGGRAFYYRLTEIGRQVMGVGELHGE